MMKNYCPLLCFVFLLFYSIPVHGQENLSIEKIMPGEAFTGYPPEDINWGLRNDRIYFSWNPEMEAVRSIYAVTIADRKIYRPGIEERRTLMISGQSFNRDRSKVVFEREGDICLTILKNFQTTQLTKTLERESRPCFSFDGSLILYTLGNNLYSLDIKTHTVEQLTDFQTGKEKTERKPYETENERWLYEDQLRLFKVLADAKDRKEADARERELMRGSRPKTIYTGNGQARNAQLSPDGNYITYLVYQTEPNTRRTIVPDFVTETGFTESAPARPKVGASYYSSSGLYVYDRRNDTVYQAKTGNIPRLEDHPGYLPDYPEKKERKNDPRGLLISSPAWSENGTRAVLQIRSTDNKDRWIMLLDVTNGDLTLIDRQHDDAWINGPGIGWGGVLGWMPDNRRVYFQSEETGYSHLYTVDVITGDKKALTSGDFEVDNVQLSADKKTWYFTSNEADPGEVNIYKMALNGSKRVRLSFMQGANEYHLSPDEKYFAIRHSFVNQPWEIYLMENKENASPVRLTWSTTEEFNEYPWMVPEIIRFEASDGALVPARLYKPAVEGNGAAVIFVHGAGYLQNAHRWWSSYFREYMFHNFLAGQGYTVMDIDYRGSAGYGRDWRAAIYRHMGGRDLEDHVDGARYLVEKMNIDADRIGIYGGSYGGFITLMAMFTKPGIFRAGAALRAVTDWAHYNHGYTSNILNTPVEDSLAYVKSSPIYYAGGLEGALLICHGMVDDNVHFQDVVRLTQRLIELGKENWEMAVYPVESHSFREASSWTDEYRRIFKLFEENINTRHSSATQ